MRNLKRALSLTLASVMLLGMMVVGSSAAAGYSDVDDNDNVEAIEVLQAVEVMVGDDRGFGPDRPVTRNEMAVVMGKLLNLDYNYYVSTCPFTDVADWAKGWVGACAANGIVSGRGNGIYDGEATVTAIEAASMMMRALGYFKNTEDYADGFQVVTVRQGSQIGIFNQVGTDANTPMTRNQVAQMALNALRSNMVDFTGTPGIEVNGVSVAYRAEYTPRTSPEAKYNAIADLATTILTDNGQYYVQLGEELYDGDLRLNDRATDDFGRPSRHWEYDGKSIGTYAKTELIRKEYTTEVTGRELYDLLGSELLNDKIWSLDVAIDGIEDSAIDGSLFDATALNRNNRSGVGATGRGVLTQVFVDNNRHEVTIAIINTYLARATADYDTRRETASLRVYGIDEKSTNRGNFVKTISTGNDEEIFRVSNEDFDVAGVKEDDSFLVTVADGVIQSIKDVTVMPGVEVSSFQSRDLAKRGSGNLTTDGTRYDFSDTAEYDNACLVAYTGDNNNGVINLKDLTYNVYLDAYGYVIGVVEVDKPTNYLFITGVNGGENNLSSITAEANAIFLDGSMQVVKIDLRESADLVNLLAGNNQDSRINKWFTYAKGNDDVYSLDLVEVDAGANKDGQSHVMWADTDNDGAIEANRTINKKNIYMSTVGETLDDTATTNALVYGNDKSVYLSVTAKLIDTTRQTKDVVIDSVDSVVTGIDNVDIKVQTQSEVEAGTGAPSGSHSGTAHGAYTLYNDDGWVIAMVIVGEDNGSNSTFAYVHNDSVAQEYLMSDRTYKWERTVVIDGVEATLTEVNDTRISLLQRMDENNWYRVRTNANGEVTAILGSASGIDADTDVGGRFGNWGYSATSVPTAYNTDYDNGTTSLVGSITTSGVETVLYHEAFTNKVPSADGHTLYVEQAKNSGIRYATNVKVVLDQVNDAKRETFFGEGENDLKGFLDDLHPVDPAANTLAYDYEVSAIIKGGVADVIIIKDLTPDGDTGTTPPSGESIDGLFINLTDTAGLTITGVTTKNDAPSEEATVGAIIDALTKEGYSFDAENGVEYDPDSANGGADPTWKFNVYKMISGQRVNRTWTWNTADDDIDTAGKSMTVNGQAVVVAGADWDAIATELNIASADKGTHVKYGNGASDYEATSASTHVAANAKVEYGYYSVTLPATGAAVDGVTYTVTNSAGVSYLKKNATFTLTVTLSGTSTGTTGKAYTVTNGSMTNGTVTATSGTAAGFSAAVSGGNKLTITQVGGNAEPTAVYSVTVTVTGAGAVSFA